MQFSSPGLQLLRESPSVIIKFIMILLSSAWDKGDRKAQPKPRMTNLQTVKVNSSPH